MKIKTNVEAGTRTFGQSCCNCRAVNGNKTSDHPRTGIVNCASDQLLAVSAFAKD